MDDSISRQAAIDKFEPWLKVKGYSEGERNILKAVLYELRSFPSAQPERKRGEWEYVDYGGFGNWHCTACRNICVCNGDFDYCPNCGADMRGGNDERL